MHPRANSDIEVARLKELLFDEEQRTLDHLEQVVQRHNTRIGTDERLTASVSGIIAEALRQADIRQHRELASAISPLVVSGIKTEIRNSRDEMVDALYPIMGRLISAYVRTAVRDVMESTNARLESSLSARGLRLRIRSLLTGRPHRELMLKEGGRLRIEELLLIRRSDGILVDRWQALSMNEARESGKDGELVGGMLSAINDFAREALSSSNDELRSLETADAHIYLRSSPGHLLAVKCTGAAGQRTERAIGDVLLRIIEDRGELLAASADGQSSAAIKSILPAAAEQLTETLDAERGRPVLAIALVTAIMLAMTGLLGWRMWHDWRIEDLRARVEAVIAAEHAFDGYPMSTAVARDLSSVTISGFAPSEADARRLKERIGAAIGAATLKPRLTSVPTVADYRRRTSDILAISDQLREVETSIAGLAARKDLEGIEARIAPLAESLGSIDQRLAETAGRFAETTVEVERLRAALSGLAAKETADGLQSDLAGLSEKLGGIEEQLRSLPFGGQLSGLRTELAALAARIDHPRLALQSLLARHAVFFESGTVVRDRAAAERFIAEAVDLAQRSGAGLRIIGYTDAMGTPESNLTLSSARATVVSDMIAAMGYPRDRLVLVPRANTVRIAADRPGGAPSERRVEIEAAFEGEPLAGNVPRP